MAAERKPGGARNALVASAATAVVVVMVGMSYAAVPLYRLFCQVTGFGGTPRIAAAPGAADSMEGGFAAAPGVANSRKGGFAAAVPGAADSRKGGFAAAAPGPDARVIRVTLDATVNSGLPWSFVPEQPYVDLRVGEQTLVIYRARNLSNETVTGVATFNVTPHKIGAYFDKVQCFCFTDQTLKPGESVAMPVVFFVDPAIARDRNADDVADIVLSYTFFRAEKPDPGRREVRAPASPVAGRAF